MPRQVHFFTSPTGQLPAELKTLTALFLVWPAHYDNQTMSPPLHLDLRLINPFSWLSRILRLRNVSANVRIYSHYASVQEGLYIAWLYYWRLKHIFVISKTWGLIYTYRPDWWLLYVVLSGRCHLYLMTSLSLSSPEGSCLGYCLFS